MTVRECVDKWATMSNEDRMKYGGALLRMLSPYSLGELQSFQLEWPVELYIMRADGHQVPIDGEVQAFFQSQQQVLENCVEVEISELGKIVRREYNKFPKDLAWHTQIPEDAEVEAADGKTQG